ncbi:LOW QUALITY PROTEIN: hypothetical protein M8C21_006743, partial [Ambrosia artemisiifolia]
VSKVKCEFSRGTIAMDILKEELVKKRQSLEGRKVFKRSEIEQSRRDQEDKRLSQNLDSSSPDKSKPESSSIIISLPKQDRLLKQPVMLFGESDDDRLDRLKYVDRTEWETNDYIVDQPIKKRQKSGDQQTRETDEIIKRMKTKKFSELCDEDKILVFFNKLLIEWNHELDEMPESEKRTALATFKQCKTYLNPLFNFCINKVLPDETKQALMLVVNCCMKRDYTAASDHYIRIAIGNSPWPIGVTMVGIHERSAREKIHTNSVAHVMNDETTRKYLTSKPSTTYVMKRKNYSRDCKAKKAVAYQECDDGNQ